MNTVSVAPLSCQLSDLTVFTHSPETIEPILSDAEPFSLAVTLTFGGAGSIALMPLKACLCVAFFAQAVGAGQSLALGQTQIFSQAGQFRYTPTLTVPEGRAIGLTESVYRITALVKVGAADAPALVTGVMEGLLIQIYADSAANS